jgi:hypothetical protein
MTPPVKFHRHVISCYRKKPLISWDYGRQLKSVKKNDRWNSMRPGISAKNPVITAN